MAIAKQPLVANPIFERIKADGIFGGGVQNDLRDAMGSTFANLRAPAAALATPPANPFGGGYGAETTSFTGSPTDTLALNAATGNVFSGGLPSTGTASASTGGSAIPTNIFATPGVAAPPQGAGAALGLQSMKDLYAASRTYNRDVAPFVPTPNTPPELAANNFGYLDKLALRSAGLPVANARTDSPFGGPTAYDQNAASVTGLAGQGSKALQNAQIVQHLQAGLLKGLPPGYMIDPSDPTRVKPIPGGPAEQAVKDADAVKIEKTATMVQGKDDILNTIAQARPLVGNDTVGVLGEHLSGIWQPAANLKNLVDSITADKALSVLQEMRASAGANGSIGLGRIMQAEIELFKDAGQNLKRSSSPDQFNTALDDLEAHAMRAKGIFNLANSNDPQKKGIINFIENNPKDPRATQIIKSWTGQ